MRHLLGILAILMWAALAQSATLQVGPTRPYLTPQAAHNAAQSGDVIEIDPVLYKGADARLLILKDLTIKGVNGRPQFDCDDGGIYSIGCWLVETTTTDVTIENVEIYDFKTPASASCIRVNTPGRLTLKNSYLHDCQQLLLTSNQGTQSFTIENNLFYQGGRPGAQEHNVYIGDSAELVFTRNRSWNSNGGQTVKTRSHKTVIAHNVIGDVEAKSPASNLELDISCGGDAYVVMNQFHQARNTGNQAIITFGPEGCQSGPQRLTVVGNTFYNEASGSSPTAMRVRKQAAVTTFDLTIEDNILVGPGVLFEAYDRNLDPDLSTNVLRTLPEPPIAYVGQPASVAHMLIPGGVSLTWTLAPGATGVIVRRDGTVIPSTLTSAQDMQALTPGQTVTYTVSSLQGGAEGAPVTYTVIVPLTLPTMPMVESFAPGWYEAPGTRYQAVYAPGTTFRTRYLVEAWSGAGFDPVGRSFLLFGGGSPDYSGNELLRVPLQGAPSVLSTASTDLTLPATNPAERLNDGKPTWRHSYSGLAYAPDRQTLFLFGGSLPRNVAGRDLWAFDTVTNQWEQHIYTGATPEASFGASMTWDVQGQLLWIKTATRLYYYNPDTRVMTLAVSTVMNTGIYINSVIDEARRLLLISNGTAIWQVNLASPQVMTLVHTLPAERTYGSFPGMAYDPHMGRVVIWNGGSRFGVMTGGTYSEVIVPGGPGSAVATGTHDRFVYVPEWRVFALQNWASQNLFLVKVN